MIYYKSIFNYKNKINNNFKRCFIYLKNMKMFNKTKLVLLKKCNKKILYDMYQDIPSLEIGSINKMNGISYKYFEKKINEFIEEEKNINKYIKTTTIRFILFDNKKPIGEVGIRTTLSDFWQNRGSQIYYKIRKSERKKGYGNIILKLALKEAKKLGFTKIRINCDDKNIASKKIILKNGGIVDIVSYKTIEGSSSSYIINI